MARCRLVEGRTEDVAVEGASKVGDFLRALVHEQEHEVDIGVVGADGKGQTLEHHGLSDARRGDNQASLPHSEGGNQIDRAGGRVELARLFQKNPPVREHGGEFFEFKRALPLSDWYSLDRCQRSEAKPALRLKTDRSCDPESRTEFVLTKQGNRECQVAGSRLEIDRRPAHHRGIGGEFDHPLRRDFASTLHLITREVEDEIVFRRIPVDGKASLSGKGKKISMTRLEECRHLHGFWGQDTRDVLIRFGL